MPKPPLVSMARTLSGCQSCSLAGQLQKEYTGIQLWSAGKLTRERRRCKPCWRKRAIQITGGVVGGGEGRWKDMLRSHVGLEQSMVEFGL